MSKRSVAPAPTTSKPPAPEKAPEPRPTRMEHAELTVVTVDYALSQEDDLVRVVVAADKLSRSVELGISGFLDSCRREVADEDDLDVLQEMAIGLRMVCDQAKQLVGAGPGAEPWTSPAQAARRRES